MTYWWVLVCILHSFRRIRGRFPQSSILGTESLLPIGQQRSLDDRAGQVEEPTMRIWEVCGGVVNS